jgi:hypothetical protein
VEAAPQFAAGKEATSGVPAMELAVIILSALACSAVMSILAFMVGRCGRKLPIDGMLPRVVRSARFSPEKDSPHHAPEPARPSWPYAD